MISTDVIGTIYIPGTYDAEGNTLTEPVAQPGYHVNTTAPVGGWEAFKVTGGNGRRVFGGIVTHCYAFEDAAEYEAYLDTADLTAPALPMTDIPVVQGVPQSVTMRQARLALLAAGLLDTVETAAAGAGPAAAIEWEYAGDVQRGAGLVPAMATALGMTDAQIDALFVTASTL